MIAYADAAGPRTTAAPLRASVIIPTRNGGARIPGLLAALQLQQASRPWEIIVVEDGSHTVAAPLRATPEVRVLRQAHRGPGAARNLGAGVAAGEFLVFVDDDCLPQPDWLEEMLSPFADERVVAVKGAYTTVQDGLVPLFVQAEYEEKYGRLARKPYINFVDGYSAAFRRSVFVATGGFDESFPLASVEDREFSLRLSRGRGLMVFNPRAVVSHRHVASFAGYAAKKFKYGRWGVRILRDMPAEFIGDDHTPPSQRWQVLLMGALPAALVASLLWSPWAALGWAGVFWGSSLPLMQRAWARSWRVGLATLPLVFLRALGLACGLAWGAVFSQSPPRPTSAVSGAAAESDLPGELPARRAVAPASDDSSKEV